jgi:hypothetical protein
LAIKRVIKNSLINKSIPDAFFKILKIPDLKTLISSRRIHMYHKSVNFTPDSALKSSTRNLFTERKLKPWKLYKNFPGIKKSNYIRMIKDCHHLKIRWKFNPFKNPKLDFDENYFLNKSLPLIPESNKLNIFTDGSFSKSNGKFALWIPSQNIQLSGVVPNATSSFKCEIFGVLATLLLFKNNSQPLKIFIDNEGVVNLLSKHNNLSITQLHQMGVKETVKLLQHRFAAGVTDELKWIPSQKTTIALNQLITILLTT